MAGGLALPRVPEWMQANFRRGLEYHEEGLSGDGMRPQTVREARQAVEQGDLPDNKPKRMAAWFARHMVDLDSAPKRGDKDFPSPGQVAHFLWGGGATKTVSERAMRWAEKEAARIEREGEASVILDGMTDLAVDRDEEEGSSYDGLPSSAVLVIATEGEVTADGRVADPGSLSWRTPPLSLTVNHDPDQRVGRIDAIKRVTSLSGLSPETFDGADGEGNIIVGLVTFNLDTSFGREVAAEVRDGFLTGVSMEVGDEVVEYDESEVMHLTEGRIGAVTLAPFQAIESARVVQVASINVWQGPESIDDVEYLSLIASSIPTSPPADWFDDPELYEPTPIFVTDNGYVMGHLALWETCHTGRMDVCLTPPRSQANYAYFTTGYVAAESPSGETVSIPVGSITMATGHASTRPGVSAADAIAHYEHTGAVVADVAVGEDDFGIWVAGALRPNVTAEQIREFRGASLSGDWRSLGGNLELVAALAVNVPGFPVSRLQAGVAASGAPMALVAAGMVQDCGCDRPDFSEIAERMVALTERLNNLETIAKTLGLTDQAITTLSARIIN